MRPDAMRRPSLTAINEISDAKTRPASRVSRLIMDIFHSYDAHEVANLIIKKSSLCEALTKLISMRLMSLIIEIFDTYSGE